MTDQAAFTCKYTHAFRRDPDARELKFSYSSIMENEITKLKTALDSWKQISLYVKRVLVWEKQWHPTALIGGSTVLFMLLWLLDPSLLTIVSVCGLVLTLCDYLVPTISSSVFKSEKWTTRKDQEFEELCTKIILFRAKLALVWGRYYRLKLTNSKMYFSVTMVGLVLLAWIGCTFNNLFLGYLFVTFLLLLPGLEHNGITAKWGDFVSNYVTETFRKAKISEKKD